MMKKLITASTIASLILGGGGLAFALTPDYALRLNPDNITIVAGESASTQAELTSIDGFDELVQLFSPDLPGYLRLDVNPNPVQNVADATAISDLFFTAAPEAPVGTITVTIAGLSESGIERTATLTITVTARAAVRLQPERTTVKLVLGGNTSGSDRVAVDLTAKNAAENRAINMARATVTVKLSTANGEFYTLTVPEGGLEPADSTGAHHINQFGRDASGLKTGNFTVTVSLTSDGGQRISVKLGDPNKQLPNQDYSETKAELTFVDSSGAMATYQLQDVIILVPNTNFTIWKGETVIL